MTVTTFQPLQFHKNNFFSLSVNQTKVNSYILMKMLVPSVSTKEFPGTYSLLQKNLPSIMRSKCFNSRRYPFFIEVRQTEIGHLFEHILLEYLCHEKMTRGIINPIHNGITRWNWHHDKKGTFHIHVDIGLCDRHILDHAIPKSVSLLTKILNSNVSEMKVINSCR